MQIPSESQSLPQFRRTMTSVEKVRTTKLLAVPTATGHHLFDELANNVATAPPLHPRPLDEDGLLGLFKGEEVGRNVVLEPAPSKISVLAAKSKNVRSKSSTTMFRG